MEEEKPLEEKTTDEKISERYNDKGGFGSMKDTYNDVRKKYPTIKYKDVQNWYRRNVDYNVVQRGQNSFVAKKPFDEFQLDLFFMKGRTELEYTMGVACIDVFSKFATVVALADKKPETLLEAVKRVFEKMGGKPVILMSDEEGSLQSKYVDTYLKKEKIKYIINRNHCPFVERFIRTFRNMMSRRLQKRTEEKWYDLIFEVISIYNYKMVNRTTDLKPSDARKKQPRRGEGKHGEARQTREALRGDKGRRPSQDIQEEEAGGREGGGFEVEQERRRSLANRR